MSDKNKWIIDLHCKNSVRAMNTESTITHLRRHGVVLPQIVDSSFLTMTNVATPFVIGKLIQVS